MTDKYGRIQKGEHLSPTTELKKGQHWRKRKPYWEKAWLENEYINKKRTAHDIAKQFGITGEAILYWLNKHGISGRSMSETRAIKYWGQVGEKNAMYGKHGPQSPAWKGGITSERQAFYSSLEWKKALSIVWKRDKGICQRCGTSQSKVHIHHIVSFENKRLRTEPKNLVTLCVKCHRFVHGKSNKSHEFISKGGDAK